MSCWSKCGAVANCCILLGKVGSLFLTWVYVKTLVCVATHICLFLSMGLRFCELMDCFPIWLNDLQATLLLQAPCCFSLFYDSSFVMPCSL